MGGRSSKVKEAVRRTVVAEKQELEQEANELFISSIRKVSEGIRPSPGSAAAPPPSVNRSQIKPLPKRQPAGGQPEPMSLARQEGMEEWFRRVERLENLPPGVTSEQAKTLKQYYSVIENKS